MWLAPAADHFSNTNGDNYSVNGQSGRYNNFEIDGQSNNDNEIAGPQVFFGNQDAIQQLQVITNDYSAQYGRNAGAVENYITKSGTNAFHGIRIRPIPEPVPQLADEFSKEPTLWLLPARRKSDHWLHSTGSSPLCRESSGSNCRRANFQK